MTARRGYPAVDRFRVAAALLVVCIHTAPLASFSAAADFALKTLARLAVPFFFTATGFFLLGELVRPGLRPRTLSPGKPRHAVPRTRRSFHFRGIVMVWNANRVKEVGESLSFPEW